MSHPVRVLIVEDEPLISMMLEDFIEALGHHHAGTADSVESALALVDESAFDCAILDVHLRGGEKCWPVADALVAAGKPFVIASGGSGEAAPGVHAGVPVLMKPYTMDAVSAMIGRLGT